MDVPICMWPVTTPTNFFRTNNWISHGRKKVTQSLLISVPLILLPFPASHLDGPTQMELTDDPAVHIDATPTKHTHPPTATPPTHLGFINGVLSGVKPVVMATVKLRLTVNRGSIQYLHHHNTVISMTTLSHTHNMPVVARIDRVTEYLSVAIRKLTRQKVCAVIWREHACARTRSRYDMH